MNRPGFNLRLPGFALVELLVSLTIIVMLMAVLLWRYPETSVRLTLANMTHTTSLLIREAQVRGSAIDSMNSTLGGYGVYFDSTRPGQLVLFGDLIDIDMAMPYGLPVGNGLYEDSLSGDIDETKTVTTLSRGYVISKLCVKSGTSFTCDSANVPAIGSLTISFTRPLPMPAIYINGSKSTNYSAACVELHSLKAPLPGHIRSIQVSNSGMIRATVTPCET